MNLLSVILLTYNRCNYLKFAIDAILRQTYNNFDFIIINNGSTDITDEIIKSYHDCRIRYIKHDTNIKDNDKYLMHTIDSKYILITHDDDIMEPTMVERELKVLESDDKVVAVSCAVRIIDTRNRVVEENRLRQFISIDTGNLLFDKFDYYNFTCSVNGQYIVVFPTMMMRKDVYDRIDMSFMKEMSKVSDWALTLYLNEYGKICVIKDPLYSYRIHENQSSSQNRLELLQLFYKHIIPLLAKRVSKRQLNHISEQYRKYICNILATQDIDSYITKYKDIDIETMEPNLHEDSFCHSSGYMSSESFFMQMLHRVKILKQLFANKIINYVIWGASDSGVNTKKMYDTFLPSFNFLGFIDSFKKGTLGDHTIQSPEEYDFSQNNYIVVAISSSTGVANVQSILEEKGLTMPNDYYLGFSAA